MVTAFILMQIKRGAINETAQQLQETQGISEVYSVSGKYDLVAIVRVPDNDSLADLVTNRMPALDGILATMRAVDNKSFILGQMKRDFG